MNLWNIAQLEPPAHDFCEYAVDEDDIKESLTRFVTTLSTAADIVGPNHPVWGEIKIFASLQVGLTQRVGCDKFFHIFQRVGHCIQKMVILDLSKLYLDLAEKFLSGFRSSDLKVMLPARSQLEYLLIRTQGVSKLLCETLSYAKDTFCYLLQKLRIGHMLQNCLMACSVIARVRVYFKALLLQVCNMYQEIMPWREKLQCGTWKWQQELELPENLWNWLNPQELIVISEVSVPRNTLAFLKDMFNESDNQQPEDVYVEENFTDSIDDCTIVENGTSEESNIPDTDIGEVIPRKEKNKVKKKKNSIKLLKKQISKAKTPVSLFKIWERITNKGSPNHIKLPHKLSLQTKAKVNKLFRLLNRKISKAKIGLRKVQRIDMVSTEVSKCAEAFQYLLLDSNNRPSSEEEIEVVTVVNPSINLVPTKKLKKLLKLLKHVCLAAKVKNKLKFCKNMERIVKSRIADIKMLRENGERVQAKTLIRKTSKTVIKRYQALNL